MTSLISDAPLLICVFVAVVGLGVVFTRHSSAAAWVLVGVFVTTHAIVPPIELQVTQGGITFYALDVVTGLMLAIGAVWLLTERTPRALSLPLAGLILLFLIHLAWGISEFGLQIAVNSSRLWLYVIGPLVFAVHAVPRWSRSSFVPLIAGATALALFALSAIARNGLYEANEFIEVGGELVDARPVSAAGAQLIVQCALIALSARFVRSTPWMLAILSMGAAVLLLQYRTVWIVAALIATVAYVRWARVAIFVNERAAALAAGVILLAAPLVMAGVASTGAFEESVRSATGTQSTLSWRTDSWRELVGAHSSAQDLLFGLPTGTSLERRVGDVIATQSTHSLYIESLLAFGVIGPVIIAALWIPLFRRRGRAAAVLGISSVAVAMLVVSQALYGITNSLSPMQGLLLGMLLQAAWLAQYGRRDEIWEPEHVARVGGMR